MAPLAAEDRFSMDVFEQCDRIASMHKKSVSRPSDLLGSHFSADNSPFYAIWRQFEAEILRIEDVPGLAAEGFHGRLLRFWIDKTEYFFRHEHHAHGADHHYSTLTLFRVKLTAGDSTQVFQFVFDRFGDLGVRLSEKRFRIPRDTRIFLSEIISCIRDATE